MKRINELVCCHLVQSPEATLATFSKIWACTKPDSVFYHYPIHLFGEISRRGEISLKMTNIALVHALRIFNHIFTKTFYIGKCKKIFSKN